MLMQDTVAYEVWSGIMRYEVALSGNSIVSKQCIMRRNEYYEVTEWSGIMR